jgi:hypothetical protein
VEAGLEFVYGLTLGNGTPWTQVVVDFDWVPRHGQEVKTAEARIIAAKDRLPGMYGVLYDGAVPGETIGRLAGDLGLVVVSPVPAERAGKDGKPRVEKSKYIRTLDHDLDGKKCFHELCYYGGSVVEVGRLAGDGTRPVRELDYVGMQRRVSHAELDRQVAERTGTESGRRARRGGRKVSPFQWYAEYRLSCGGDAIPVLERTLTNATDKINRSENVRQVPPGTGLYDELYPHRSSIEGFNSWVDGRFWLRRARCKGAARQELEQLAVVSLYNALVWRANRHALAPPDAAAA